MLITKFCRIGTVVRDEQQNVIPGSYRFSFWDEKNKECSFKLGVQRIDGLAIQVERATFEKDGKVIEFYKFLQSFGSASNLQDNHTGLKEIKSMSEEIKAMY